MFWLPLYTGSPGDWLRFHGRQSLILFAALVLFRLGVWLSDVVLGKLLGSLFVVGVVFRAAAWLVHYPLGLAVGLGYLGLMAVCIVQSVAGNCWRVPVLGAYLDRMSSTTDHYTGGNDG